MGRYSPRPEEKQIPRLIPLYRKADCDQLKKTLGDLATVVERVKLEASTEELWTMFKTTLLEAVQQFIPYKTALIKKNKPWITTTCAN